MNFFTKAILGSVAVLLAATAIVLLFRSREGPKIEALLREAATWAERGDAERVAALVDDNVDDYPGGAEGLRAEIRREIRPGAFEKLELLSLDVGVDGDEATVRGTVRITASKFPYPAPLRFELTLRRRESGWKIVSGEMDQYWNKRK